MPYVSAAQRRFAHTATAKRKGFPTEEFDKASKGMKDSDLPDHVGKGDKHFGGKRAAPFTKRKKRPPMYPEK